MWMSCYKKVNSRGIFREFWVFCNKVNLIKTLFKNFTCFSFVLPKVILILNTQPLGLMIEVISCKCQKC